MTAQLTKRLLVSLLIAVMGTGIGFASDDGTSEKNIIQKTERL